MSTARSLRDGAVTVDAVLVVPFRDRGRDPLRPANLDAVRHWWDGSPWPVLVVDDGRTGDEQFNRHAAYNRGADQARALGAEVVVYAESDLLVPWQQIDDAVRLAAQRQGLVVPFGEYHYMGPDESVEIRADLSPWTRGALEVRDRGVVMGPLNVVSLASLDAVGGWDEAFEGNWYDDNAMERAFAVCCGPRRHIAGPAWHLFHLPGWAGEHLTEADRAATEANRLRWGRYQAAGTPEAIRALTGESRAAALPQP